LLGSIVATTDPAAVIAVFREVSAPRRLTWLVEGEALLNDAAAIALFILLLGFIQAGRQPSAIAGLTEFTLLFAGGGVFGYLAGRLLLWTIRHVASFSDPDGNGWLFQEVTVRLPGRVDADDTTFTSSTELAAALRRAAAAHGEHEKRTGHQDADWPDWYAEYVTSSESRPASSCRHEQRLRRHRHRWRLAGRAPRRRARRGRSARSTRSACRAARSWR
jgi:hypothetical protein